MILNQNKKAFTLVELIVVITILAILGTIAFMSFQGYSASSRDSVRISDLQLIGKSLDLFKVKTGKYPDPENGFNITYSGAQVRTQGIFGETNRKNIEKLNKTPLDPLLETEYTYSVLNNKREYQLGSIIENKDTIGYNQSIINKSIAVDKTSIALIKGNYNGILAKVLTGSITYALAVPSIINSEIGNVDILSLLQNNKLVYSGYANLPGGYNNKGYNLTGETNPIFVNTGSLVLFAGDTNDLKLENNQIIFIQNLQSAYSGTIIKTNADINNILKIDISGDKEGALLISQVLINANINSAVEIKGLVQTGQGGFSKIVLGSSYSCVVTNLGGVKCWGNNNYGQLGDGTIIDKLVPTQVSGLESGVKDIALGSSYSCVITNLGGVKCWGNNNYGQLGDGTIINKLVPTQVSGLESGASSISLGSGHSCVLLISGGVKCWGYNGYGQLGDNYINSLDDNIPADVIGLTSGVSSIALGSNHSCALLTGGGVKCWGNNWFGQLGNNSLAHNNIPVNVVGLTNGVVNISLRNNHTCALLDTGGVKCWGVNSSGQLGDGTIIDKLIPTQVSGLTSGVVNISLGNNHTCALLDTGGVKCWGDNYYNYILGDNTLIKRTTPVDVIGLESGVSSISLGSGHSCVLLISGGVKCWGDNSYGQLGDGSKFYSNRLIPTDTINLNDFSKYFTSKLGSHSCYLNNSGGVKCWGVNSSGQLGDGTTINAAIPVDVVGLSSGVVDLSLGTHHSCALLSTGGIKCWGHNYFGQLGNNSTIQSNTPVDVLGLTSGVSKISLGGLHSCALLSAGGMKCWGYNWGSLGDNSTTQRNSPVNVYGLTSGVSDIAAGSSHTCAILTTGGLKCWGLNNDGQLGIGVNGNNYFVTPQQVTGLTSGVSKVSSGFSSSCALLNTGGVKCWGSNSNGHIGDGTTTKRVSPVDVIGLSSGVVDVSASSGHTCVILNTGGMKCWGANWDGRLGDNSYNQSLVPVDVYGLSNGISNIYIGQYHTCAKTTMGGIKCWGDNRFFQFLDGYDFLLKRDVISGE